MSIIKTHFFSNLSSSVTSKRRVRKLCSYEYSRILYQFLYFILFYFIFTYGLLADTVSVSDHAALNGRMRGEY
jgi:hypothetical protein